MHNRNHTDVAKLMEKETKAEEFEFTFEPGPIGIKEVDRTKVEDLDPKGKAKEQGVEEGWTIIQINDDNVEDDLNFKDDEIMESLKEAEESGEKTTIKFRKDAKTVDEVFYDMDSVQSGTVEKNRTMGKFYKKLRKEGIILPSGY